MELQRIQSNTILENLQKFRFYYKKKCKNTYELRYSYAVTLQKSNKKNERDTSLRLFLQEVQVS